MSKKSRVKSGGSTTNGGVKTLLNKVIATQVEDWQDHSLGIMKEIELLKNIAPSILEGIDDGKNNRVNLRQFPKKRKR